MSDALLLHALHLDYPDTGETTKFGPNAWNAALLFGGGVDGDVIVRDAASATGASWLDPTTRVLALRPCDDLVLPAPALTDLLAIVSDPAQAPELGRATLAQIFAADPLRLTPDEKAALVSVGSSPSGANPLINDGDPRLSNVRAPAPHAANHAFSHDDELSVADLSGVLADPQHPIIGPGADEAVAGTDARLSDARVPVAHSHPASDITGLGADLSAKAPLASPALTGTPTAPTAASGTNTTQLATTAFTRAAIADLIATAPTSLDTLNELAAALGNDPNFAATLVTSLAGKVATTRSVNGQPLSADVVLAKADVGLALVENTALSTGNAATATLAAAATVLATARLINGVSFDGSANITVPALWGGISGTLSTQTDLSTALGLKLDTTALATWAGSANLVTFGSNVPLKNAANTFAGLQTFSGGAAITGILSTAVDGIALTSTDGFVLQNTTLSTAGVAVQQAPRLRLRGHVWNTTSAADNTDDWTIDAVPGSALVPTGALNVSRSLNGGAATTYFSITSLGIPSVQLTASGALYFLGRAMVRSPFDAMFDLTNNAQSAGIGLYVGTNALCWLRTRGSTGNAALMCGKDAIAVTSTDGVSIVNDTAATAGVAVQQSPRLRLRSNVWNTTTPANNTDDWLLESVPVSGATPSGLLKFGKSLNGGATTFPLTVSSAGAVVALASVDAPAYKVGGVAGASKTAGPVTSITVVNGIVTACS